MGMKRFMLAATLGVAAIGCGGVNETKISVESSAIESNVRQTLEQYEKTGKTGSTLTALESDINGIKASDSSKGEALMQGHKELVRAQGPAEVKATAKKMLEQL